MASSVCRITELSSETKQAGCRPLDASVGSRKAGPSGRRTAHIKVGQTQSVRYAHGAGPLPGVNAKTLVVGSIGTLSFVGLGNDRRFRAANAAHL